MYPHQHIEPKVKVATRQLSPNNARIDGVLLLLVLVSVIVLIGRSAGGM